MQIINSLPFTSSHMRILQKDSASGGAPQRKIIWQRNEKGFLSGLDGCVDCPPLVENSSRKRMSHQSGGPLHEMNVDGFLPKKSTLSALMLYYAENGLLSQAQITWAQLINSSFVPSIQFISKLFDAYGKQGHFDEVIKILHYVNSRNLSVLPDVYSLAISCFGRGGQLELMEDTIKEMVSRGFHIGSETGEGQAQVYEENVGGSIESRRWWKMYEEVHPSSMSAME